MTNQDPRHVKSLLSYFNSIIKRALKEQKYEQIGRFPKFFKASDKIDIPNYDL